LIRPTLDLAVAFNRVSREADEWFEEPDDLVRVQWLLDRNGEDGSQFFPTDDRIVADLLVSAAAGANVERQLVDVLRARQTPPR
jgi:hypothetical protein